jgi:hypothetical protein
VRVPGGFGRPLCFLRTATPPNEREWLHGSNSVLFSETLLTMPSKDDGLSAFLPKNMLGKNHKGKEIAPTDGEVAGQLDIEEDDDYVIEAPVGYESLATSMPMSFGKQARTRDLNASFAKTKRVVSLNATSTNLKPELKEPIATVKPLEKGDDDNNDDESSDDMIGPMPVEAEDFDEQDSDDEDDEDDEFPVSHEIILKDHTKVTSNAHYVNTRLSRQSPWILQAPGWYLGPMTMM